MVCAQVMGQHVTVTIAGASGNFQLNVMLPLIGSNVLESIRLLSSVMRLLADSAIAGLKVRKDKVDEALARNPILVTALNPVIGYEKAAAIAKRGVCGEAPGVRCRAGMSGLPAAKLKALLDPAALTKGGIGSGGAGGGG
jgi:fumarate hydratase class II